MGDGVPVAIIWPPEKCLPRIGLLVSLEAVCTQTPSQCGASREGGVTAVVQPICSLGQASGEGTKISWLVVVRNA